ncbi:unnamed protein product [Cyclocybe aegerita]|uniref:Uncharacterized protein n=1 Tax=Cyclocybe aegerita TaxID=1973307 RepID=A0A8S0W8V2_CYCAE|nr:unnamed protein product [Cyclocybe aegerita]
MVNELECTHRSEAYGHFVFRYSQPVRLHHRLCHLRREFSHLEARRGHCGLTQLVGAKEGACWSSRSGILAKSVLFEMNHSTTNTATYTLAKYSRSYPVKRILQKTQNGAKNGPDTMSDWQHFTNPLIQLVLDVKKTSNAEIESVRLRIIWQLNSGMNGPSCQADVTFEDLELLSFSAMMSNPVRNQHMEGLPLKAVYRDTTVGIRYLHAFEDGFAPTYRRFQIAFQSASEASEFIEYIKPVCPCKLNPSGGPVVNAQVVSVPQPLLTKPVVQNKTRNVGGPKLFPFDRSSTHTPLPPGPRINIPAQLNKQNSHIPTTMESQLHPLSSSPFRHQPTSDISSTIPLDANSSPLRMTGQMAQINSSVPLATNKSLRAYDFTNSTNHVPISSIATAPSVAQNISNVSTLPLSSLPRSSSYSSQAPVGSGVTSSEQGGAILQKGLHLVLSTLLESTSIYDIPSSTLEQVVAEIIREDGFVELVEKISEMLTIRRIANV